MYILIVNVLLLSLKHWWVQTNTLFCFLVLLFIIPFKLLSIHQKNEIKCFNLISFCRVLFMMTENEFFYLMLCKNSLILPGFYIELFDWRFLFLLMKNPSILLKTFKIKPGICEIETPRKNPTYPPMLPTNVFIFNALNLNR